MPRTLETATPSPITETEIIESQLAVDDLRILAADNGNGSGNGNGDIKCDVYCKGYTGPKVEEPTE
jgi:hypothetical protein